MFEPLREYFKKSEKCPVTVSHFFDQGSSFFWLIFLENQMELCNETILKIEKSKCASFEIAEEIRMLQGKISNRKELKFIPMKARVEYNKLSEDEKFLALRFVDRFYSSLCEYLKLWSKSLDGTEVFYWMTLNEAPTWQKIEPSVHYAMAKVGDKINGKLINNFC